MKITEKKQLKHGMKITCKINGDIINNARISIDKDKKIYICQNERQGDYTNNKFGFAYSWLTETYNDFYTHNDVTDIVILERTIQDGLIEGDIIVDTNRYKRKILGICGKVIFISAHKNFTSVGNYYTLERLIKNGFKLEEESENELIPEYTLEELKEKLGHNFILKE